MAAELSASRGRPTAGAIVGYAPGVFDLFHIGHLHLLRRARERCGWLIAGVVTDDVVERMKGRPPIVPFEERLQIVAALRVVDEAVPDDSPDKRAAWHRHRFGVLYKGDDWRGTPAGTLLEAAMADVGAVVEYLPYTAHTSSTHLRAILGSSRSAGAADVVLVGLNQDPAPDARRGVDRP